MTGKNVPELRERMASLISLRVAGKATPGDNADFEHTVVQLHKALGGGSDRFQRINRIKERLRRRQCSSAR